MKRIENAGNKNEGKGSDLFFSLNKYRPRSCHSFKSGWSLETSWGSGHFWNCIKQWVYNHKVLKADCQQELWITRSRTIWCQTIVSLFLVRNLLTVSSLRPFHKILYIQGSMSLVILLSLRSFEKIFLLQLLCSDSKFVQGLADVLLPPLLHWLPGPPRADLHAFHLCPHLVLPWIRTQLQLLY